MQNIKHALYNNMQKKKSFFMFNDMKQKKLSDLNLLVHFDKKNFINQVNFFSHYIKFAILFSFFFLFVKRFTFRYK